MRRWLALLMIVPAAACGDAPDVDFGGGDLGEDRFAIHSRDGGVRLGLTGYAIYIALSDSVIAEARAEMADTAPRDGIRGTIGGMVRGGVQRALAFRASHAVEDVRDIRWEDGRMVIQLENGRPAFGDKFEVDGRPVDAAFTEPDVVSFAAEFRKVKRRRGGG